jgi:hypothetical protein
MDTDLFQGLSGQHQKIIGGPVHSLKQGSVGPVLSDLQFALANERKQHQEAYGYQHGNEQ